MLCVSSAKLFKSACNQDLLSLNIELNLAINSSYSLLFTLNSSEISAKRFQQIVELQNLLSFSGFVSAHMLLI
jgi:hypothetical protein